MRKNTGVTTHCPGEFCPKGAVTKFMYLQVMQLILLQTVSDTQDIVNNSSIL